MRRNKKRIRGERWQDVERRIEKKGRNVSVKECTAERTKMYKEEDIEGLALSEYGTRKNTRRKKPRCWKEDKKQMREKKNKIIGK